MAEYQSSYSTGVSAYTAGLIPDQTPGIDITMVVENAALAFGVGCKYGTNSGGVRIFDDEDATFAGVSVRDVSLEDADDDQYPIAQEATIRRKGPVVVTTAANVSAGDTAYVVIANGNFTNATPGSPAATVLAGRSYFMEDGTASGLVKLWVEV